MYMIKSNICISDSYKQKDSKKCRTNMILIQERRNRVFSTEGWKPEHVSGAPCKNILLEMNGIIYFQALLTLSCVQAEQIISQYDKWQRLQLPLNYALLTRIRRGKIGERMIGHFPPLLDSQ